MIMREETGTKAGTGKEKEEVGFKCSRSGSTVLVQRVPLGPGRSQLASLQVLYVFFFLG
jgi:hypothetical protein